MQTKAATELYDYWARRRGERSVPLRSAIEPADIASILPDVFILEGGGPQSPCFRLAGTRLCAQYGKELKGADFAALFAPDQRARIARIAGDVMARAMPAILRVQLVDGALDTTEAEIVLLPLMTGARAVDRVIGAFAPLPGQRQPLSVFRYATLGSVSVMDPDRPRDLAGSRPPIPVPTSVMAMRPAGIGQKVSRVMHLRIFEGGRRAEET